MKNKTKMPKNDKKKGQQILSYCVILPKNVSKVYHFYLLKDL